MIVGIASDHHGLKQKSILVEYLTKKGYGVVDFGPSSSESVDYPVYAFKVAEAIRDKEVELGILMCGTGIGMSIAANKVNGIRCARIASIKDAQLAREHNNANIIAFSGELPLYMMKDMVDKFLTTKVSAEGRHIRRVNLIDNYEN